MSDEPLPKDLNETILDFVRGSSVHVSPIDLERYISNHTGTTRKSVRNAVRDLVNKGFLEYTDKNGRTRIDMSFNRHVRLSPRITVVPPGMDAGTDDDTHIVILNSGTAFGRGDHPTTQLCVRAIDDLTRQKQFTSALDIGTGSGILALVTAKLGVPAIWACDRDRVSLSEAMGNVRENRLDHIIHITEQADMDREYDLIIANLRYPTLIDLYPSMVSMTKKEGFLVLSGIKEEEMETIRKTFLSERIFSENWYRSTKGWSGIVLEKLG